MKHFLYFLFSILFIGTAYTKEIVIPGDANTIKEAIELATSGDTVLLATNEVYWGGEILIENKDISITGGLPDLQTKVVCKNLGRIWLGGMFEKIPKMFQVINSDVKLQNLSIVDCCRFTEITTNNLFDYPTSMWVDSGFLHIEDCVINVSITTSASLSIIRSTLMANNTYYWTKGPRTRLLRGLRFNQLHNEVVNILDSIILTRNDIAIQVSNSDSTVFNIHNAQIIGDEYHLESYRCGLDGQAGISIEDSKNITLSLYGTNVEGGDGRLDCDTVPLGNETVGKGAPALYVSNSIVSIEDGLLVAGNGADGYQSDASYIVFEGTIYNGGHGGHGFQLENSTAYVDGTTFTPGIAGIGAEPELLQNDPTLPDELKSLIPKNGVPGLPYYLDAYSEINFLTNVEHWSLF